jgi:hypothetical protein
MRNILFGTPSFSDAETRRDALQEKYPEINYYIDGYRSGTRRDAYQEDLEVWTFYVYTIVCT